MTLCKKGGGLRKKSNFECVNKNDILIGGEGGDCQTQPTKFTTFASEKYFVNRSSSVPSVEGSWTEI